MLFLSISFSKFVMTALLVFCTYQCFSVNDDEVIKKNFTQLSRRGTKELSSTGFTSDIFPVSVYYANARSFANITGFHP